MFETTKTILKNNTRSFVSKIKESPMLYIFFFIMMISSILLFAFVTLYFQIVETNFDIKLEDVFFMIFFIFMTKSSADFYNQFVKSKEISYALCTPIKQKRTVSEIFGSIFLTNIVIWFAFSTLYIFGLIIFRINISYPLEYIVFNLGVITAICLGPCISINFFSPKRIQLLPTTILLIFYLYLREPYFVVLTLPLALLHITWSLNHAVDSHQCIRRKERINEKTQNKTRSIIKAIFHKETTILWRDKLLMSFISTSAIAGIVSGYLYLHGDEIFIPETLQVMYGEFLPSLFVFLGVFVVVIYTAVFPALTLFLNEEKTMWIIRHIPLKNQTIILGKTSVLLLCFVTGLPFIPYILIFIGIENLLYVVWFLVFSYLASIIIALPLGVKYVGKKSDIMLLYSVAMMLLFVLGIGNFIGSYIYRFIEFYYVIYLIIIFIEIFILFSSLKLSSKLLALKYNI
jgi:hypothetical protein